MIPRVIHYCWFGGNTMSELTVKCIESWRKYCPDFEIKEWNESNFDIEACPYVKEAFLAKKWAFVSDYARFKILYENGGIYFDTDVELIRPLREILRNGPFMGCEIVSLKRCAVNPGLGVGVDRNNLLFKKMLEDYENSHFIKDDGMEDYRTIVERTTEMLTKYGFAGDNMLQKIEGITIYPSDYFCPIDYRTGEIAVTDNTKSIHWYNASWLDNRMQKRRKINMKIYKIFKGKLGEKISRIYMSYSYYWEWISTGNFKLIKEKINNKRKLKAKTSNPERGQND